jgi:hypothetical protein
MLTEEAPHASANVLTYEDDLGPYWMILWSVPGCPEAREIQNVIELDREWLEAHK